MRFSLRQHADIRPETLLPVQRHQRTAGRDGIQGRRRLPIWGTRVAAGGGSFALAFVIDVATEQRWSMVLGGSATAFSLTLLFLGVLRRILPLLLYLGTWIGFNAMRAVADSLQLAIASAGTVAELERTTFGGVIPSAVLQTSRFDAMHVRVHDAGLTAVHLSFFVTPMLAAAWLFARNRALLWRYTVATAICFAVGLAGFALLPTAPPWLLTRDTNGVGVARIASEVLASFGIMMTHGGGTTASGYVFEPNHLASMPSVHVAAVALIACAAWSGRRVTLRMATAAYWLLMAIAVVYLGEHYVLDVITGSVVAIAAWLVADRLTARQNAGRR